MGEDKAGCRFRVTGSALRFFQLNQTIFLFSSFSFLFTIFSYLFSNFSFLFSHSSFLSLSFRLTKPLKPIGLDLFVKVAPFNTYGFGRL